MQLKGWECVHFVKLVREVGDLLESMTNTCKTSKMKSSACSVKQKSINRGQ